MRGVVEGADQDEGIKAGSEGVGGDIAVCVDGGEGAKGADEEDAEGVGDEEEGDV